MEEILGKIATESLNKLEGSFDSYRIQPHQNNLNIKCANHIKSPSKFWADVGIVQTINLAIEKFLEDIRLFKLKQSQYGDSVSSYSLNSMLEQTLFKVVAAKVAEGMGNIDSVHSILQEIRMYSAMILKDINFEDNYKNSLGIIAYKELNYGSAWKLAHPETIIDLICSKLNRHKGKGVHTKKMEMDIQDIINYTIYAQILIERETNKKYERQEDEI